MVESADAELRIQRADWDLNIRRVWYYPQWVLELIPRGFRGTTLLHIHRGLTLARRQRSSRSYTTFILFFDCVVLYYYFGYLHKILLYLKKFFYLF